MSPVCFLEVSCSPLVYGMSEYMSERGMMVEFPLLSLTSISLAVFFFIWGGC